MDIGEELGYVQDGVKELHDELPGEVADVHKEMCHAPAGLNLNLALTSSR